MSQSLPEKPMICAGGCHCGAVRFRVVVRRQVALDCNCSVCSMKGFLHLIVPAADFELLEGESSLSTYTFGTHAAEHHFCRHCGIHSFYIPRSHPDGVDVNLRCLNPELLSRFRVESFDGRNWEGHIDEISGYEG